VERDIKVVVAELDHENGYGSSEGDCDVSFSQRSISLDELFSESWFMEYLRYKGYYNKDDLDYPTQYLNNFVYEYKGYGDYNNLSKTLTSISVSDDVIAVYQEVIGPERIAAFAKWKKSRDAYLQKEEDRKKAVEEKKKLRAIQKAKRLLEKEGVK
jgi:hypothetical protein